MNWLFRALIVCFASLSVAQAATPAWIEQSNEYAKILLEINARYNPESATSVGVEGFDKDVLDLKPQFQQRQGADLAAAVQKLEGLRASTPDALVGQDLDILVKAARQQQRNLQLNRQYLLTFLDLPQAVF